MTSGVELVRQAVVERLRAQGVQAEAAYSREWAGRYQGAVVAVGVRGFASTSAGLGSYLGAVWDREAGTDREIYGRQAELTLALDAYAPREAGAAGCLAALEAAHDALTVSPAAGLRPGRMDWGEARFAPDSGMFVQRGSLQCGAFFVAAVEAETGLLLSFRLKGVPWIEHDST